MITLAPSQASAFISDACTEIKNSHDDAWNDITVAKLSRPQYEAQFVARLCVGAKNIVPKWRPRIKKVDPSLRLSFAAVFTHQSPYVTWPIAHRCELADLLIAIIDKTISPGTGRAVLIQAKQSDIRSTHLTTRSEKEQFDLLSGRPVFDVGATPAPSGIDLTSYRTDDALLYGLTPPDASSATPSAWSSHRWETADGLRSIGTPYRVSASACLANRLVEQLQSNQGWEFKLPPAGQDWTYFASAPNLDHWSALINYLLRITCAKPLTRLKNLTGGHDRGYEEPLYLIGRTSAGNITFATIDCDRDEAGREPFDWIGYPGFDAPGAGEWRLGQIPWAALGGDNVPPGGGDERGTEPAPSPADGPISTIIFEIGRKQEG